MYGRHQCDIADHLQRSRHLKVANWLQLRLKPTGRSRSFGASEFFAAFGAFGSVIDEVPAFPKANFFDAISFVDFEKSLEAMFFFVAEDFCERVFAMNTWNCPAVRAARIRKLRCKAGTRPMSDFAERIHLSPASTEVDLAYAAREDRFSDLCLNFASPSRPRTVLPSRVKDFERKCHEREPNRLGIARSRQACPREPMGRDLQRRRAKPSVFLTGRGFTASFYAT